jgi:hypothetical protein
LPTTLEKSSSKLLKSRRFTGPRRSANVDRQIARIEYELYCVPLSWPQAIRSDVLVESTEGLEATNTTIHSSDQLEQRLLVE